MTAKPFAIECIKQKRRHKKHLYPLSFVIDRVIESWQNDSTLVIQEANSRAR